MASKRCYISRSYDLVHVGTIAASAEILSEVVYGYWLFGHDPGLTTTLDSSATCIFVLSNTSLLFNKLMNLILGNLGTVGIFLMRSMSRLPGCV